MPKTFSLASIQDLDGGRWNLAYQQALSQVTADIRDRPGDPSARKVTLEVRLSPALESDSGVLDTVEVEIRIKTSVPHRQSVSYPMLLTGHQLPIFEPASPLDPRQGGLYDTTDAGVVNTTTGELAVPNPEESHR